AAGHQGWDGRRGDHQSDRSDDWQALESLYLRVQGLMNMRSSRLCKARWVRDAVLRLSISAFLVLSIGLLLGGGFVPKVVSAASTGSLTIFAAASLTDAYTVLGKVMEQRNLGLHVIFNFAGSQQLATQIEQGAKADVFASADQRWMDYVRERGLVAGTPREFVRN